MVHPTPKPDYAYQHNPSVPDIDWPDRFTVMDAQCALCARGARWIARNDRANAFRIIPVQTDLGAALMRHYGLDPDDPLTWLYFENGRAYGSFDAVIRVGWALGGVWKALAILWIVPAVVADWVYLRVARNRYRLSGTADLCNMPDPAVQKRLLQV